MAMLGHVNTDLSLLKRELMRPTLHADNRNLCNPDHPVTSLLFGDDLQKEMKDLKETSMIGSKVSSNYHSYDRPNSLQLWNHCSRRPNNYRSRAFFSGRSPESPNPKEIPLQEGNRTTITPQTKASVHIESDSNTQYMIEIAKQKVKGFKAGQIANCVHQWKMLTSDPEILDIVQGAHIQFECIPIQNDIPLPHLFSPAESEAVAIEIAKLMNKGVIEPCMKESHDFISKIFLRPKKDGSHRLILNLKSFNQNVTYHHFKMDTLHSILKLVKKDCWMASVDLKDAY